MDSLCFPLVRPMNRLAQVALFKYFTTHTERLTAFNAKLIQRYALLDHVDHRAMLELLTKMAHEPLTPASFFGLRQLLQAVQRFPLDFESEKRMFEDTLIRSVLTTPPDTLSSEEYSALWSFAVQTTAWSDVLRLSNTFHLQDTLPLQSEKEFRTVLNQMLMATVPILSTSRSSSSSSSSVPSSPGDSQPRGVRLLRELVGEEEALRRAFDGIRHRDTYWTERESAVSTFIGVVHAVGRWPSEHIPDAKAWKQLALHPTTLHDVDLHQLLRVLERLHSPVVPEYVRETLDEAICTDLWRCYSELPNEPLAVFFGLGESRLRFPFDGEEEEKMPQDVSAVGSCSSSSPCRLQEILLQLHVRTVEKQLRSDGPPLSLTALINLLISNTFLRVQGDLLEAVVATLKKKLESSSPSSSSRCLTPLQAAITAACMDHVELTLNKASDASASSQSANVRKDMESIGRVIAPLLSYKHLREYGCARCVAVLLCDCPRWVKEWKLEEGCMILLREQAENGFTKAQLQRIMNYDGSGHLSLDAEVKEFIKQQAARMPSR